MPLEFTSGAQRADIVFLCLVDKLDDVIGVFVHLMRHIRGKELRRVMRFEIGGLVTNQRISKAVRFVEAVRGEFREPLVNSFATFSGTSFATHPSIKTPFIASIL